MKRALVAILGGLLTLAGIALLVLPRPGFVLIAAGLAVLATQFERARKPLEYAKGKARQGMREVSRSRWRAAWVVLCAMALLAIGIIELTPVNLPFVTTLSAILLMLSGLGLIGTLIYAKSAAGRRQNEPTDRQSA